MKGDFMKRLGAQYVIPVLIIVVGVGWLLNLKGVMPRIDWIWTSGMAAAGILTLAAGGIDKLTMVVGPLLLLCSGCSLLRQLDKISAEMEVPIIVIALGVLMVIAYAFKFPSPTLFKKVDKS